MVWITRMTPNIEIKTRPMGSMVLPQNQGSWTWKQTRRKDVQITPWDQLLNNIQKLDSQMNSKTAIKLIELWDYLYRLNYALIVHSSSHFHYYSCMFFFPRPRNNFWLFSKNKTHTNYFSYNSN